MPWTVHKEGDEYCVVKEDTGERVPGGCHPSQAEAERHKRAIEANYYADKEAGEKAAELSAAAKAFVEKHPDGLWLTIEEIGKLCPDCGQKAAAKGLDKVNLLALKQMPEQLMEGLCASTPGESFSSCMERDFGDFAPGNKEGFCAWLHHECTGEWPGEKNKSTKTLAIKAVGDWELDVLAVPFGSPKDKDADGQYFSQRTNLYLDTFKTPLVVYYHGFDPEGRPQGDPVAIGQAKAVRKENDGWWVRVALDKANQFAKRVWEAAKKGIAKASSGSISHLVRVAKDGEILSWPLAELSLIDEEGRRRPSNKRAVAVPVMKTVYERVGATLPDLPADASKPETEPEGDEQRGDVARASGAAKKNNSDNGDLEMDATEIQKIVAEELRKAREEDAARAKVEAAEKEKTDAAIKAAVDAAKAEWEKEAAKGRRLPLYEGAPFVRQFQALDPYDNLNALDQSLLIGVLNAAKADGRSRGPSEQAYKAAAIKLQEAAEGKEDSDAREDKLDHRRVGVVGVKAMKMAGLPAKADEVMQQDLVGFGDEWVGVAYSQALWEAIRVGTFVAAKLPSTEVPPGHESIVLPLEGADPTFYKVAETTDIDATMKFPVASVTSSQMATAQKTLSLAKMGARTLWSGELEEDSLIPFVAQLRKQLNKAGSEQLEHAIVDGDTATGATTNINHIGGTPGATDLYLLFNGFRKSPLVTTTANSRSAAGGFVVTDFIQTVKMMGTAGMNALDFASTSFIVDLNVHWKSLELPEVQTRDVFVMPTLEKGRLTGIYGYDVFPSAFMHYKSTARKANTAGKVDQTTQANNTTGSILAVRWDQWYLGYRRRMTIETERIARSDATEIVALMRLGLVQRDTEASAITYNVGI